MRAAVISAPGTVEITTVDDPSPRDGEVVVAVAAVGICGTDLHILAGEHGTLPVIPGHELSGTIVEVCQGVDAGRIGERVAVDPSLPCGACRQCARDRPNLCPTLDALGVTIPGGAATYVAAPAASCVPLPDHVDLVAAALVEPLSCAVHALDVLGDITGASVAVYGAGTMGLLTIALVRHAGADAVTIVEPNDDRRARAIRLGCATDVSGEHDVVVDATGNVRAIADGLEHVAAGGTFLQLGVTPPDARVEISPYDVYRREIRIVGSMAILHSFERAAELFAAGVIDAEVFVTAQLPLERYEDALDAFARGEGVKTLVVPA